MEEPAHHTLQVMKTREAAVMAMRTLQSEGWRVTIQTVALTGQCGFYCVGHEEREGRLVECAHSILWNMYEIALTPIVIDCKGDQDLLTFVLQHGNHETYGYFEFDDEEDMGFVCYCEGHAGHAIALRISPEVYDEMNDESVEFLERYLERYDEAMEPRLILDRSSGTFS